MSIDSFRGAKLNCDVLVVGSGAGGLVAALTACVVGLDVIVIEKTDRFGGTTAHSEGMIWVPLSAQAKQVGKADTIEEAFRYLEGVAGNHLDRAKALTYLESAKAMLTFVEAHSRVRYSLAGSLDYYSETEGATVGARSLNVMPLDGRTFGPIFDQIRRPLRSTLAFGGMTVTGADFPHALRAHRSPTAFAYMARLTARYAWDRVRGYDRGTRISHGHAVAACLVEALTERKARLLRNTALRDLIAEGGRVTGGHAESAAGRFQIEARHGVVLATGGFSNDPTQKAALYAHVGRSHDHALLASEAATGDGIAAARVTGAAFADDLSQPAAWTPASLVPQRDGSTVAYPHYVDRNKPGFIAVDPDGRRFTNEAAPYSLFVAAMIEACRNRPATEAWLIADARAVGRYGIGAAPPFPLLLGAAVRSGYLTKAASLDGLAQNIGLPASVLADTIARANTFARSGVDEDFHRGETAYDRANGDPTHRPNPNLGVLEMPPFYAVKLLPSDIGTFAGLKTDAAARVLGKGGTPISGLYAVGNDAASAFGGTYPAAGITVGLAMTFGYVAGRHLADVSTASSIN